MSSFFSRLVEAFIGVFIGFTVYYYFESMLYEKLMEGGMDGLAFMALSFVLIVILVSPIAFFIKKIQDKGY